jgi:hypothetical protein
MILKQKGEWKMFKKLIKGAVIGGALLAFAGTASAADYNLNIYGASAQHKFWLNLAPDFLTSASGGQCASAQQSSANKKHGIARGLNCTFAGGDDTIYIRYSSRASYAGVNAILNGSSLDMVDETTCAWGGPKDDTCSLTPKQVNLGASDVAWDSFVQTSTGWEDGNQSFPGPLYSWPSTGDVPQSAPPNVFRPIVVPFTFYASNNVCKFRCVAPKPWVTDGPVTAAEYAARTDHLAYNSWGWQCDPTKSTAEGYNEDCIGYHKCLGGVCNGGVNAGNACTTSNDCPSVNLNQTRCEGMPINNVTQTMVQQIFSGQVTNWSDFGPYYDTCDDPGNDAILRLMRHAGSGTHATLDLGVMKGVQLITNSVPNVTWHFTSSSDLTKACTDFRNAIAYADADKLLDFKGIGATDPGCHMVMFNGVEPTRSKIVNGEYEFWAAQNVYYDLARDYTDANLANLRGLLEAFSSNAANLTVATLGNAAKFWAAQDEMLVEKLSDSSPITRK